MYLISKWRAKSSSCYEAPTARNRVKIVLNVDISRGKSRSFLEELLSTLLITPPINKEESFCIQVYGIVWKQLQATVDILKS